MRGPSARSPTRLGTALAYDGTTLLVQGEATQSPCVLVVGVWDLHPVAYPCQVVLR